MNCVACSGVLVSGERFCTTCGTAVPAPLDWAPPSQPAAGARAVVPPVLRWLSWGVDLGVLVATALIVSLVSDVLGLIVGVAGGPAYYLVAERNGGTLGHRATKIRIIDTETNAEPSITSRGIRLAVIAGLLLPLGIPFLVNAVMLAVRPGWVSIHDLCSRSEARR